MWRNIYFVFAIMIFLAGCSYYVVEKCRWNSSLAEMSNFASQHGLLLALDYDDVRYYWCLYAPVSETQRILLAGFYSESSRQDSRAIVMRHNRYFVMEALGLAVQERKITKQQEDNLILAYNELSDFPESKSQVLASQNAPF